MARRDPEKKNSRSLPVDIEEERVIFEAYLRSNGLKLTNQRKQIFEEVFGHHGHIDADGIAAKMHNLDKGASRATVYRTLDLLVESGLVKPVRLGTGQHYYEHVHSGEHHDHLVCTSCGKIFEFYSHELEKYQGSICDEMGFTPKRHTMIIYGTCRTCSAKRK
jgi:Fur family ferric uptake transcriptional regulator